jgi:hypothetical protein
LNPRKISKYFFEPESEKLNELRKKKVRMNGLREKTGMKQGKDYYQEKKSRDLNFIKSLLRV